MDAATEPVKNDVPGVNVKVEPEVRLSEKLTRRARHILERRDVVSSSSDDSDWSPGNSVRSAVSLADWIPSDDEKSSDKSSRVGSLVGAFNKMSVKPTRLDALREEASTSKGASTSKESSTSPLKTNIPQIQQYLRDVEGMSKSEVKRAVTRHQKYKYQTPEYRQKVKII